MPDREWTSYRDAYFQLKEKYYTLLRGVSCSSACTVGQPYSVPVLGDCPVIKDFSIRPYSASNVPACTGGQTMLLTHDAGSLNKAVTLSIYYPPGFDSSSLPQSFNMAVGESQKTFCVPEGLSTEGIAVKSVTCSGSSPATTNPTPPATDYPSCITPSSSTNYWTESSAKGLNKLDNGDFSAGPTGFASTYTYIYPDGSYSNPNGTPAIGFYRFVTNPQTLNSGYYSFGDHTTGSGNMLYLDGGADPTKAFWSKTVTVDPNKTYVLSFWASTATANQATLQMKINGAQVGKAVQLPATPGWQNLTVQWDSGDNTTATITIHDLNPDPNGNDFALDDMVFAPVCVVPATASCIKPTTSTDYYAEASAKGINQVSNGDFSAEFTGFSSTYTYVNPDGSYSNPNATPAGGFYRFVTNPQTLNAGYFDFGDHTTGSGYMLYLDGGADPTKALWSKATAVEPNKTYVFSFWASTATANPAILQLKVNGVQVGNTFQMSGPGWVNLAVQWDSGNNTSAILTIHDLNTAPDGNDFAIDDIVFAPVCVSGSCPEVYAIKDSRFPEIAATSLNVTTTAQGNQLLADTKASILSMARDQFTGESLTWMARLTPGLDQLGATPETRAALRVNLIAISLAGADLYHPYGSSTLPSGTTAGNGYASFGDAIKGVLGLSTFTPLLNPWLIDAPYPYLPLQQSVEKTISSTSTEICGVLSALSNRAQANNTDLYSFLVATYGNAMTLTPAEVVSLQKSCANCRFILPDDITLPVFLDPGTKGCIVPPEYAAAKNDLSNQFAGSLSASDSNYENIFSTFMNHRWGFSLTYDDYTGYEAGLAANPSALLCNQEPYSSTNGDPYACIKSAMEVAVANGEKDYNTYITDQKNAFKSDYVRTCSLAQANAGLSASQQVYHYTLYYYDQADNLIRTVPPEGVSLLSDQELKQVKEVRDNDPVACNYTGPTVNADKNQALQALSSLLSSNNQQAMEFWLYNPSTGDNNQLLMTSPDRMYMVQLCISGHFFNADVYTMPANQPQNSATIIRSNHFVGDISALLPLNAWTHVVVQGQDLAGAGALNVYVNGSYVPAAPGGPPAACSWTIDGSSNPVQAADNISTLKHMRLYNGRMLGFPTEIVTNAQNACFMPSDPGYMLWFRFNVPAPGSATTYLAGSTNETRFIPVYPDHALTTNYAYNSMNQVVRQTSPDGGTNRFWYDALSRPFISQNDKQAANNDYSYTVYDALGRITEVGQKHQTTVALGIPGYRFEGRTIPKFLPTGTNSQITQTIYDAQPAATGGVPSGLVQENLRKRVAASLYRETQGADVLRASYYNYDLDGNVKTLTQQADGIGLKQLGYEYDLVSGKVNFVRYQDGQPDQFYYKYDYDAENRLTDAWSGTAALVDLYRGSSLLPHNQKLDAHYDYYLHGPLARTELGDVYGKVQGTDYAYTLQGWLKGINGTTASVNEDMGADGTAGIHSTIARDAHAMSLFYYGNDYKTIGGQAPFIDITGFNTNFTPLYNGNIAASTNKLAKVEGDQYFHTYKYDQLNRLNATQTYQSNLPWALAKIPTLNETFTYDGNGNILTALRNNGLVGGLTMDDLGYVYDRDGNGRLLDNKLLQVKDAVEEYKYPGDLDDQADPRNYRYDALGNLTHDTKEGIDSVEWTVYGKIRGITKSDGTNIGYAYGPSGNRASKTVNGVTTWYVRDAQGNVMGVYSSPPEGGGGYWREQHLYGSSRLGTWNPNINLSNTNGTAAWDTTGKKSYELVNHLGNVMATITDKRLQHSSDGSLIDYFDADVQNAQEYYSFGSVIPGRTYLSPVGGVGGGYRYGFNGHEKDNEVAGDGNHLSFGDYGYDPRIGRRWNVDPVVKHDQSPYSTFANNPIWLVDVDGRDTTVAGKITAQSEIMKKPGDPSFVPAGVKLESSANVSANIIDGKFTKVKAEVDPKEFESPVLGGIRPAFTEVRNLRTSISKDGTIAKIHYDVQTQLSNFEVVGQFMRTFLSDATVQTNIITVTQSVDIELKVGSIKTTFDGSTFPESRYRANYTVNTGTQILKGSSSATLQQSSYYKAVKAKSFSEHNNPQKTKKVLTY